YWRRILASSNGIWIWLQTINTKTGTTNMGSDPTQNAMPSDRITSPRYIGLRVMENAPRVTSLEFFSEVGMTSVFSTRNSSRPQNAIAKPSTTSAMPSGTTVGSTIDFQG